MMEPVHSVRRCWAENGLRFAVIDGDETMRGLHDGKDQARAHANRLDEDMERIINSAFQYSGFVVTPEKPQRGHHEIFRKGMPEQLIGTETQGFVTSKGRFVGREEGLSIAEAARQIKQKHGQPSELYSEDMW